MYQAYLKALSDLCQPIRAGHYPHTLHPMRALLAAVGNPQRAFPSVVVTGSTGKGTTCLQIARLLRASGLNVGLYISPHLHSFRERFLINDEMISHADFVSSAEVVQEAAARLNHVYSTFEQATALALHWFAQKRIDIAVLEIGLGGRFDAVNAVNNALSVFTRIECEHAAMLGGSLQSIAWHKAGIIQPGGHAVTVKQQTDAFMMLNREAAIKGARLHLDGGGLSAPHLPSLLAVAAWENLLDRGIVPRRAFANSLSLSRLPGRLEQTSANGHALLIDGGHTPAAARFLLNEMTRLQASRPVRLVVGMLQDKSAHEYLSVFDQPQVQVTLTTAPGHRASPPETLLKQAAFRHAPVEIVPHLSEALARAYPEDLIVIAGSLRMAALARETFGLLSESELAEAQATRAIFEGSGYLARLKPEPRDQAVTA